MKDMFCKRFIIMVTVFTLCCSVFVTYGSVSAETNSALHVEAGAAILVEEKSGKILYQKNANQLLSIASMTKMMSEYLVYEAVKQGRLKWDQKVKVSDYAYEISQDFSLSNVSLEKGAFYTVKELYEAMAISSANGATIVLAEAVAGKEVNFVKIMNDKAKELGLKTYKFVNSTGLTNKDLKGEQPEGTTPEEENKMSARDCAMLAQRLIQDFPKVLDTAKIPQKTSKENGKYSIKMENTNWMLKGANMPYEGVDGLKTGFTSEAGNCFTSTAERNGIRFISVVMNTNSHSARFKETKKLLDYGFTNFEMKKVYAEGSVVRGHETVQVKNAKDPDVTVHTQQDVTLPVIKGDKDFYKFEYKDVIKEKEAPIKKGVTLSKMIISSKDNNDPGFLSGKSLQVDLVTKSEVEKINGFIYLMRNIGSLIGYIWNFFF
ncbi:D-alanyl-D-alanine carboxypeptidase [Bacillus cereus VD133]|uniref:serine-type D-Ala-D-Ala carboxypeptidase n=1 Tax=Bacillus cereus VD133 TaxID=1053233 RepID=A0A9W5UZV5_BACCE|nr:D-alanyl-D-alanine carboxypeptidase family protein [Bacillus cereus]EOO25736.1 D-alanyl-D-alanine carboxypeptidase [Bacillus cereus VD133]